jgi:DNA-binding NtrC family response regulator
MTASCMGVVDWLDKPLDEERLVKAVERAVRIGSKGRARILHVEDDIDLTQVIAAQLDDSVRLEAAGSVREARERLDDGRFDLVILDVVLPDGSGLDLLPLLKDETRGHTPVVIFSGEEVRGSIAAMVEAALVKSRTTDDELVRTIRRLITLPQDAADEPQAEA